MRGSSGGAECLKRHRAKNESQLCRSETRSRLTLRSGAMSLDGRVVYKHFIPTGLTCQRRHCQRSELLPT
jgi:hypothetical protein